MIKVFYDEFYNLILTTTEDDVDFKDIAFLYVKNEFWLDSNVERLELVQQVSNFNVEDPPFLSLEITDQDENMGFKIPLQNPEKMKKIILYSIKKSLDLKRDSSIQHGGHNWGINDRTSLMILGKLSQLKLFAVKNDIDVNTLPTTFSNFENEPQNLTFNELESLGTAIAVRISSIYEHSHDTSQTVIDSELTEDDLGPILNELYLDLKNI
jgi:hypothetical protein